MDYEGLSQRDITMLFRKSFLMHDTVYRNLVYLLNLKKSSLTKSKWIFICTWRA